MFRGQADYVYVEHTFPRNSATGSDVGFMKSVHQRSSPIGRADQYRYLEAKVRARAWNKVGPILRAGWENLAEAYARLAEQSEELSGADLTYDPMWDLLNRSRH